VQQATEQYEGFGLFLRAMTGLDYKAAAIAFAGVRSSQTFTPQQDDYLELLIEVLAKNGTFFILILEWPGMWPDHGRRVGFRHGEAPGR
jgi:hypothetical protein